MKRVNTSFYFGARSLVIKVFSCQFKYYSHISFTKSTKLFHLT